MSCGYGSRIALAFARLSGTTWRDVRHSQFKFSISQTRLPARQGSAFSRRVASELLYEPSLEKGGRRECRVPAAPVASRAKIKKHASIVTTGSDGFNRHSLRNGFNGFLRALPGDRALLPPSFADTCKLDASVGASGPHDFAVRVSAVRLAKLPRPLHPAPRFVTIAIRPLCRDRT
jgi:hypothetical protein